MDSSMSLKGSPNVAKKTSAKAISMVISGKIIISSIAMEYLQEDPKGNPSGIMTSLAFFRSEKWSKLGC
jgi:hypothetical protein